MAATRKLTVEILGDAKGAMGAFGTIQKGTSNLGDQFVAFGKKAATAFAAISVGAIAIGKSAVDAASDLGENLSKVNVVFGDAADAVIDFSKKAATAFGQSQNQALQAAGNLGIFGKAAGLTGDDLSGFTTELVGLASDMASFSNTTPQEAIDALGAALRGESEPIRKYGVLLDDASMRAKAMEMGIYDGNGALTAQQKILAANALIFEQTTDAQGDFARTSDGLANQQRILAARFENLKTVLGRALVPIALKIVSAFGALIDKAQPLVERLIPKLRDLFGQLADKLKPVVSAIRDALAPILEKVGDWMKRNTGTIKVFFGLIAGATVIAGVVGLAAAFAALFNPITLIIGAVAAVAAGLYYAYQQSETFRNAVDAVGKFFTESLVPAFQDAFEAISNIVTVAVDLIQAYWATFGDSILAHIKNVFEGIKTVFQGAFQFVKGVFDVFIGVFTGDWGRAWEGIKQIFGGALETLKGGARLAVAPIVFSFNLIKDGIGAALGLVKDVVGAAVGWIKEKFIAGFTVVSATVRTVFSGITSTIRSMVQGVINFFIGAINRLIGVINTAIRAYNRIPLAPDISTISPIPQVQLAKGGIVTGPTIALVGEAGPEAVVPLSGPYMPDFLRDQGGGDTYIQIQVQAGLVSSPDQVGQQIIEAIRRAERRSGQVFANV
jgi:phage-related protein